MLLEKINTIAQKGETVVDCCVLCVCVVGWIRMDLVDFAKRGHGSRQATR